MVLRVATATDLGRRREQNEDCHAVWAPTEAAQLERRGTLLVIADGMGGAVAGEVASRLAVETVVSAYRSAAESPPLEALRSAVEEANGVVHRESIQHPDFRGMGTTCTAVAVIGRRVLLAHVGDSRAYLAHAGSARPLTRDHTLVAHLVAEGQLSPEEARSDPRRNVVTRSIGVSDDVEVDVQDWGEVLEDGDALVLCSDGLHGVVPDAEIGAASLADPEEACRQMVSRANARGGPDNITVIVARADPGAPPPRAPAPVAPVASPAWTPPAGPPAARAWPAATILSIAALALLLALVTWTALRFAR